MKLLLTIILFLPIVCFSQEIKARTDTTWKKTFRTRHADSLHQHMRNDTLIKIGDQIEYNEYVGGQMFNIPGWKVLLHKLPKDTVIFMTNAGRIIPFKPKWEADTDWYNKYYRHHRSKIDSL